MRELITLHTKYRLFTRQTHRPTFTRQTDNLTGQTNNLTQVVNQQTDIEFDDFDEIEFDVMQFIQFLMLRGAMFIPCPPAPKSLATTLDRSLVVS